MPLVSARQQRWLDSQSLSISAGVQACATPTLRLPQQVATFDADGDGQLCYEEFRALLCDRATQQALKF